MNRKFVLPLLALTIVYLLIVAYPGFSTITESLHVNDAFSYENYRNLFDLSNTANLEAVWNSVAMSMLSVVASGIIGTVLAVALTQIRFRGSRVLSRLAIVPIALPPLVGTIAFLFVFGETGILPRLLGLMLQREGASLGLGGMGGIVAVHAYSFNVYFFLLVSTALQGVDRSVLEAARLLGSSPGRTFFRIILPELRPALVGGGVLTFMASMASFTAPLLFAGNLRFLTLQIFNTKVNGDLNLAAAQSVLLAAVSIGFYVIAALFTLSGWRAARRKGASQTGALSFGKGIRAALISFTIVIVLFELLPLLTIIVISFVREGSWTWQIVPEYFTVENYARIFSEAAMLEPVANSVIMTVIAVFAALIVGTGAAFLVVKGARRSRGVAADVAITLPYAVPGTVVAISLILAFNRPVAFLGGAVLVGTFWILPLAYLIRVYPLIFRSTAAALEQLDDSLLEAARGLGAGMWVQFRRIILPLTFPGIMSGATLAAIACLGEFVSSILLYTYSSRPMAIEVFSQLRSFNLGAAAAYSVILLLLVGILLMVTSRMGNKGDTGSPLQI